MQVLVSDAILPGGWCSFCFYQVGRSSHCSCNLCWSCRILLTLLVVGCLVTRFLYCQTVPGGGGVSCVLVTTSFEVVVPGGGSLDVQWSTLPVWWWTRCLVPCWDDETFCFVLVWFYSLDNSGRFLCLVGLKDFCVPANLFLLHN